MKKLFLMTVMLVSFVFGSYGIRNFGYSTLLLMVEETENGVFEKQKETKHNATHKT